MTDDLVKRLRWAADNSDGCGEWNCAPGDLDEAADRIEELEANINLKADFIDATMNQLAASDQRIEELEAKLAKAVADMKALTDVSTLMQSSASHDRFKHNTIVTDSIWSQWSRQLKFVRTTLAELTGEKDE